MRPVKTGWYLLAVVLIFGGWMVGVATAGTSWNLVREATLQSSTTPIDAANQSVAVFTDVPQTDRDIRCRYRNGPKGSQSKDVDDASLSLTVTRDGTVWTLIGLVRDGGKDVQVACLPRDKATDPATYAVAAVEGFTDRQRLGLGIGILSVSAGFALVGWTWWCRRARDKESTDA